MLVGLMSAQAVCVVVAMWHGWGVQSFAQWITPAAACLTVNASILAGLRRDAKRNHF